MDNIKIKWYRHCYNIYYIIFVRHSRSKIITDANRRYFKEHVNTLAHTKLEGESKVLILKSKYRNTSDPSLSTSTGSLTSLSAQYDPRNNVGLPLPVSPLSSIGNLSAYGSTTSLNTPPRQPPPYRNPPPVVSPSPSMDSISLGLEERPTAPPRRKQSSDSRWVVSSLSCDVYIELDNLQEWTIGGNQSWKSGDECQGTDSAVQSTGFGGRRTESCKSTEK